ncbi:MAG: hydrogenase [Isosphaeraceae bacterium]|nr:MAG: hydrogenase [Isosphaeraceae bacterium]
MNLSLFRHAFFLILLSMVGAFFFPAMAIPRLGLSAHTIGILSGVLLIAVGAIWHHFQLSSIQQSWLKWSWLYSSYANWLGCLIGGIFGAGKMTPIASSGVVGADAPETVVAFLLGSVVISSLVAVSLSLWCLRHREPAAQQDAAPDSATLRR